jgi:hypothetical protein
MMGVVGIVGSRDFKNLERVRNIVRSLPPGTMVVSGGARGVDKAAETEARDRPDLPDPAIFHPRAEDRARCGNCCYHKRNRRIVEYVKQHGGYVLAFVSTPYPEVTPGTQSTLEVCQELGVPYDIHREWDVDSSSVTAL